MKDSDNFKDNKTNQEKVKKQKAGLNAIRPDDYVEKRFKDLAKENNFSQTEMFNSIFWNYILDKKNEKKQLALNLESEINLISNDLNNILKHFKSISDKAQETIISITTNAEQTEKNLTSDIDTLGKQIEELKTRNSELELSNSTFNEVKANLESQLLEIAEKYKSNGIELTEANKTIKEKDKTIKDLEKNISLMEKNEYSSVKEINRLKGDLINLENNVKNLQSTNDSLNNTINSIDTLKKSEISSIESKYKLLIEELELKLRRLEESKQLEINQIKENISSQYEADKKMAIAESTLELAELKSRYGEVLVENANLKQLTNKNKN